MGNMNSCKSPVILVLLLSLQFTILAVAQSAQEIAVKAFRSTVMLVMEDEHGQPISIGSGFIVEGGFVASNLHVVEGATRGYAKPVGKRAKYDIEGIVGIDAERDLVLLKIEGTHTNTIIVGSSESVRVGDQIFAVGNPQGLEGTFSQGIISSIRRIGKDNLLQITAPISPGSSGGPVLNMNAEVIGVSVATYKGGQNLNFAIPSVYLSDLIEHTGEVQPLGRSGETGKASSILAGLGGKSSEAVEGGQLTWKYKSAQLGGYSFSIRNKLRDPVEDVYFLIIFYDVDDVPIDVDVVQYQGVVLPGLAKRLTSSVDGSVQELTTTKGSARPLTRVEFRVLNFSLVE